MSASMSALPSRPDLAIQALVDQRSPDSRLAIAWEMIDRLDTLTAAGQRYLMSKVLAHLQDHVFRMSSDVSPRNRRTLAELLEKLNLEFAAAWPDVLGFSQRAGSLVSLLSAVS